MADLGVVCRNNSKPDVCAQKHRPAEVSTIEGLYHTITAILWDEPPADCTGHFDLRVLRLARCIKRESLHDQAGGHWPCLVEGGGRRGVKAVLPRRARFSRRRAGP